MWLHDFAHPLLDQAFYVSHILGTAPFGAGLVIVAAAWWTIRGRRREAMLWIVLGISTYLLQKGLKVAVGRPRPDLWDGPLSLTSYAFPSGHALAAATFSWLMARAALRGWPQARRRVVFVTAAMALYIGFGRLYLGLHWPSDVVAGWLLGVLQTWLVTRWLRT